jgi:Sec-independent protein translocase protein TatA
MMDKFYILFVGAGGPEILVILLVLLLLFGAKEAPHILRNISDFFLKIRNSADEFKHEIMYSDMRSEADERQKKQNAQYLTEDIEDNNIDDQNQQDGQDVEKI